LVVNKPPGVLTVPGRCGGASLLEIIPRVMGIEQKLFLVHRLDRGTSGVLVLAKTSEDQRALATQFQERAVRKEYLAIVRGSPNDESGRVETLLGPHDRVTGKMIVKKRKGKHSVTEWELVERLGIASLILARPLTGRQHQIRVHLKHIGLPLLVDKLYGKAEALYLSQIKPGYAPSSRKEERPLISRLTLHASALSLTHPVSGHTIRLEAEPPKDFRAVLTQLRKVK
jgi:23S rRNA pseudouridine955/2504/2580 synthase/23S rRNA pseudouridine1911/1915/1917 synthase